MEQTPPARCTQAGESQLIWYQGTYLLSESEVVYKVKDIRLWSIVLVVALVLVLMRDLGSNGRFCGKPIHVMNHYIWYMYNDISQ